MFHKLLPICLILLSLGVSADELTPTKSGMFDVGGFSLYLECYENDNPKLILEQGFGRSGSDGVWLNNIKALKDQYSICLYDRSGLGKSEKGPVPFTINDNAKRLHALLSAANINPPYYFAGGSYASYIITAYNNLYPDEVLGAVFIAPPTLGYFYTMGTRWPESFETDNEKLKRYMAFEKSVLNPMFERVPENIDHMESYKQLSNANNFDAKPIIVIRTKQSAEPYDPPFVPAQIAQRMESLEQGAEDYFKSLSTDVEIIYSTSEKHHLHISDPELVVSKIQALAR
ncbi:alpha/beta fold hydrolase [Alteromonas facilis]|uniref:alpha/beta fold hydrolase n=1 Tax=Alteromonas facilis TaxID=2048004 RepID=UPI000C289590|nr:alpha/beta fold hydrolase [Alteromonas facilis]